MSLSAPMDALTPRAPDASGPDALGPDAPRRRVDALLEELIDTLGPQADAWPRADADPVADGAFGDDLEAEDAAATDGASDTPPRRDGLGGDGDPSDDFEAQVDLDFMIRALGHAVGLQARALAGRSRPDPHETRTFVATMRTLRGLAVTNRRMRDQYHLGTGRMVEQGRLLVPGYAEMGAGMTALGQVGRRLGDRLLRFGAPAEDRALLTLVSTELRACLIVRARLRDFRPMASAPLTPAQRIAVWAPAEDRAQQVQPARPPERRVHTPAHGSGAPPMADVAVVSGAEAQPATIAASAELPAAPSGTAAAPARLNRARRRAMASKGTHLAAHLARTRERATAPAPLVTKAVSARDPPEG